MKAAIALIAFTLVLCGVAGASNAATEQQIDTLISQLTLKDKVSLVTGNDPKTHSVRRLGIPSIVMNDGPLGVRSGRSTAFPSGLTVGAAFDPELAFAEGVAIADEARLKKINMMLGPCVNISRQPFGGRNFESYGEDPLLTSVLAASYIRGMQSHNVIATVKHFAVNDQEINRKSVSSDLDLRALFEIHLPAFKAAVDAGVYSVMSSYNLVNGVHASENGFLLNQVLRDMWGFKGFVVSDWTSTYSTVGTAMNGLDLEMPSAGMWGAKLLKAVQAGQIPERVLDEKARHLLRSMFAIGLMGPRKVLPPALGPESVEHQQLAQRIAAEGTVLLKNDGVLPLSAGATIAVIGPHAAQLRTGGGGSSHVIPFRAISPLEALRSRFSVLHAEGALIDGDLGIPFTSKDFKGGSVRAEYFRSLDGFAAKPFLMRNEPTMQLASDKAVDDRYGVRLTGELIAPMTGEFVFSGINSHTMRIFVGDKKIISTEASGDYEVVEVPMKLVRGRSYKFVIETGRGDDDTAQELQVGWRLPNERRLSDAVQAARSASVAVLFLGMGNEMESEGGDRESLALPDDQLELLNAVVAANPNTVVVLTSGGVITMPWLSKVRGVMQAWYPGSEGGLALAQLLSGEVNPSGKLPISYIKRWEDSSAYTGSKKSYPGVAGRVAYSEGLFVGYRFLDRGTVAPLFPFGFGLSYSTFSMSGLSVARISAQEFTVSLTVTNTGAREGAEVAQVYVGESKPIVSRPVRELKAFQRVMLKAGESRVVSVKLDKSAFAYFDDKAMSWRVNPGAFEIAVGSSSRDLPMRANVSVQ